MRINNIFIGQNYRPFIIAEMSGNHNQSLERALALVEAAAKSGVDAIKLQTYTAETMTLNLSEGEFFITDPDNLWEGTSLYELYKEAYTPWEWHDKIFNRARELGLIAFSSPFDETAVDFLESLNVPCYKIASFENIHIPLIKKVASTGKPIIISTGMATFEELEESVQAAKDGGCKDIILLKCTSSYPSTAENSHIRTIFNLRERFGCEVGLSDHTMGVGAAVASIALGATVIEKHFTLNRADGGGDSSFSMEPDEMALLVKESECAWLALGDIHYGPTETEKKNMVFRRSIYITENLKAGDVLNSDNIRIIRPGLGLPPKYFQQVIGKVVKVDTKCGTPLSWKIID